MFTGNQSSLHVAYEFTNLIFKTDKIDILDIKNCLYNKIKSVKHSFICL